MYKRTEREETFFALRVGGLHNVCLGSQSLFRLMVGADETILERLEGCQISIYDFENNTPSWPVTIVTGFPRLVGFERIGEKVRVIGYYYQLNWLGKKPAKEKIIISVVIDGKKVLTIDDVPLDLKNDLANLALESQQEEREK